MKRVISIATVCLMAVLVVLTTSVAAQEPNTRERTLMTFSGPVELPGLRLDAGSYTFQLADTPSRNVVQVMSQDGKEVLGQWLFVQAERPEVSGDTIITFRETAAGATPAVQFWYFPGEKIGKEFIYPKDQAMKIAARTGATVQSDDGPISPDANADATTPVAEPAPQAAAAPAAPAASADVAANAPAAEPAPVATSGQQESTVARNELPQTASPLALAGLLGLLSLAGAAGIRTYRR
jgi:hypothetical protein